MTQSLFFLSRQNVERLLCGSFFVGTLAVFPRVTAAFPTEGHHIPTPYFFHKESL
jgi:hypothetical protein